MLRTTKRIDNQSQDNNAIWKANDYDMMKIKIIHHFEHKYILWSQKRLLNYKMSSWVLTDAKQKRSSFNKTQLFYVSNYSF